MTTEIQNLKALLDSIAPEQGKTLGDWDRALTCNLVSQAQFDAKVSALRQVAIDFFIPPVVTAPQRTALTREYVDQTLETLNSPEISYVATDANLSFSRSGVLRFTVTIGVTSREEFNSLLDSIK